MEKEGECQEDRDHFSKGPPEGAPFPTLHKVFPLMSSSSGSAIMTLLKIYAMSSQEVTGGLSFTHSIGSIYFSWQLRWEEGVLYMLKVS